MAASDGVEQLYVENGTSSDGPTDSETVRIGIQEYGSSSLPVDHSLDDWLRSLKIEEEEKTEESVPKRAGVCKIHRVPLLLREKEARKKDKCYDPLVVSIGPYHHGQTKPDIERLKIPLARSYFKESKPRKQLRDKVTEIASRVRECYPQEVITKFEHKAFTKMMILDGCFIIQFLLGSPIMGLDKAILPFVIRDLLLLENQLPYQVLKALLSLRFNESEEKELIEYFMCAIRGVEDSHDSWIEKILRRFHFKAKPTGKKQENESDEPIHLLDLFRSHFINKFDLCGGNGIEKRFDLCSYPASKELRTMGIHFKPSRKNSFTDIKFSSLLTTGILTLPRIILHNGTKSLFLNLVAYEASPDAPDDSIFSSYLWLMDTLIDQAQDVEVLRKNRIIYNLLGSDQQAAELFNEVSEDLVIDSHSFSDVMDRLHRHYNNRFKTSISEWLDRHFGSPWALIAFLAATFIIIMSFIQTYVTSLTYCMSHDHPHFWCPFSSKTRP